MGQPGPERKGPHRSTSGASFKVGRQVDFYTDTIHPVYGNCELFDNTRTLRASYARHIEHEYRLLERDSRENLLWLYESSYSRAVRGEGNKQLIATASARALVAPPLSIVPPLSRPRSRANKNALERPFSSSSRAW